jgi:hypothetical protein
MPLEPAQDISVSVSRFATIRVLRNVYSVPARLVGQTLLARVRAESIDLYVGMTRLLQLPRLRGTGQHRIDYRHIIDSLVRKPGAFAQYRYRDELFPSLLFRQAYDRLLEQQPQRADQQYVRLLHLAATTSEHEVETALTLLLEQGETPTLDAVRELAGHKPSPAVPELSPPTLSLSSYDQLLNSKEAA